MASIEVLDYRKDGEVEARRVTLVNITQRWPILPYGDQSGPFTLLSPSPELAAALDRAMGELQEAASFRDTKP